eukprot:GILK01007454.1.p1 GENE.GILK01007454.1~~GILK01007454.1.p1  ORF type:complete len:346 (-),score=27.86 GILK01007454.1:106-1104(-)
MEEVLPAEFRRSLELVPIAVTQVPPKHANSLVSFLLKHVPTQTSLAHLKRIRKRSVTLDDGASSEILEVVLCLEKDAMSLPQTVLDKMTELSCSPIQVAQASAHAPVSKDQLTEWNLVWPLTFKRISWETLSFSDQEMHELRKYMALAYEAGETSAKAGHRRVGCVIVHPESREVIATAGDESCAVHKDGAVSHWPLRHAVMVTIDRVAQRDLELYPSEAQFHPRDIPTTVSAEPVDATMASAEEKPYLCTGLDLYVTKEPCVMCSMALVHSRIRRVFYNEEEAIFGGLGGRYQVHTEASVNHRFHVFKHLEPLPQPLPQVIESAVPTSNAA